MYLQKKNVPNYCTVKIDVGNEQVGLAASHALTKIQLRLMCKVNQKYTKQQV